MNFTFKLARRLALLGGLPVVAAGVISCEDDPASLASLSAASDNQPVTSNVILASPVLVGAGNIGRCNSDATGATARLIDGIPGTVFTAGDNAGYGTASDFTNCYDPSWGRHKSRTRPTPGHGDYMTTGATGYFGYFGAAAGPAGNGYYSYDLGDWHVVALNSSIAMNAGSPQETWLRADLAASSKTCTVAIWHYPRFSSVGIQGRSDVEPLWKALYEAGAEIIINAHDRVYERFGAQTPAGGADAQYGIRQFTVGTGGQGLDAFVRTSPNSESRNAGFGVLQLTLNTGSYNWAFVPMRTGFTDSGSAACHGKPGTTPTPSPTVASVTVTPAADTVAVGASTQLSAVARDASGNVIAGTAMSWISRDSLIAKVTAAGLVTGIAAGATKIIVSSSGKADTSAITVMAAAASPVASVTVSPASASIVVGATVQLSATLKDAAGNTLTGQVVTWSSSAPVNATVSSAGLVTGNATGSASITATSGGKSGTAVITVTTSSGGSTPSVNGFFASPSGSNTGDGSITKPWNLATALAGGNGKVKPGNTIWLRGGTYRGTFVSTLAGTATAPITVRGYPGERAIMDGAGSTSSGFRVRGQYSIFRDFELINSDPIRSYSSTSSHSRTNTLVNEASNTKFINLVIHDGGVAFYSYEYTYNVEVYGCILYNNGWQGTSRGHGHALYVKSNSGPVYLRDNIMFNQFGYGVHAYSNAGSGGLNNIKIEGNVSFNNGTLSSNSNSPNILFGGEEPGRGITVRNNLTYFTPGYGGRNLQVGYSSYRNADVSVQGNYAAGGSPVVEFGYWTAASVGSNTLIGSGYMVTLNDAATSPYVWSSNTHHRSATASAWRYKSTAYTFSGWRTATGLGSTDQTAGNPTSTRVFVKPNAYEAGRATIVVYNWSGLGSVSANLGGVLAAGDRFEVRNVQNLNGAPVLTGTFGGSTISLPMSGVTPPTPIGLGSSRAPRTGPQFDVFIVRKL